MSTNYPLILPYFIFLYGISFAIGIGGWKFIRWQELDLQFNCLRLNDWYYQFSDTREQLKGLEDPQNTEVAIYAAVVVETPCCNFLYRGWVRAFRSNRKGGLERLHLQDCIRRVIPDDDESTGADSEGRYYPINCDSFLIEGHAIKNLSVQYVYLKPIESDREVDEVLPEGPKDPITLALRRQRKQDDASTDEPSN